MDYFNKFRDNLRSFNPALLLTDDSDDGIEIGESHHSSEEGTSSTINEAIKASKHEIITQTKPIDTDLDVFTNAPFLNTVKDTSSDSGSTTNRGNDYLSNEVNNYAAIAKINEFLLPSRGSFSAPAPAVTTDDTEIISAQLMSQCEVFLQKWTQLKSSTRFQKMYLIVENELSEAAQMTLMQDVSLASRNDPSNLLQLCLQLSFQITEFLRLITKEFNNTLLQKAHIQGKQNENHSKLSDSKILSHDVNAQKRHNEMLDAQYTYIVDMLSNTKQEIRQSFIEELVDLRSVAKNYREKYQNLLDEYKEFVSSFKLVESGDEAQVQDNLKELLAHKDDLLSQLKFWQEGYAALSIRYEVAVKENESNDAKLVKLHITEKQLKFAQCKIANMDKLTKSLLDLESELKLVYDSKAVLQLDLNTAKESLGQFNAVLDEVQKTNDHTINQYQEQLDAMDIERNHLREELIKASNAYSQYKDISNHLEEAKVQYEELLASHRELQQENEALCSDVRLLHQQIKENEEKKSDFIDKRTLLNMISSYMSQKGNRKRREDIFLLICEVLGVGDEDKMNLGLPVSQLSERRPLSELFVEFLDKESSSSAK